MIWEHVALLIYLRQCLLGTLVYLQLEDVDGVGHVHHGISPAYRTLHLRLNINIQETEHQIENGLIMLLTMILQIVWNRCQIGTHVLQCCLDIIAVNRLAEPQQEGIIVGTARIT